MGGIIQLKYLLDTHIWLWSVSQPEKLSRKVVCGPENFWHQDTKDF